MHKPLKSTHIVESREHYNIYLLIFVLYVIRNTRLHAFYSVSDNDARNIFRIFVVESIQTTPKNCFLCIP